MCVPSHLRFAVTSIPTTLQPQEEMTEKKAECLGNLLLEKIREKDFELQKWRSLWFQGLCLEET
jgi:hypothetical protein